MPEISTFNDKINCVFVDSYGVVDLQEVQESLISVSLLLKKHRTNKLIVDVRKQDVVLQLVDTFTICKDVVASLPHDLKIAYIVTSPPQQSHSFFVLLSEFLGRPVKVFYTIETAEAWFNNNYDPRSNPFYGKVDFPSVSQ